MPFIPSPRCCFCLPILWRLYCLCKSEASPSLTTDLVVPDSQEKDFQHVARLELKVAKLFIFLVLQ